MQEKDRPVVKGFMQLPTWDPVKAPQVITDIQNEALARIDWYSEWYKKEKRKKACWSKWIRFICVVLFILTAMVPLLHATMAGHGVLGSNRMLSAGYIAAALGSALLFLDRFFDFSSGWIRINTALTDLGNSKRDFEKLFQNALLIHPSNTLDGFQALIDTIKTFDDNTSAIVKTETDGWVKIFQSGNDALQKSFSDTAAQQSPGDLQINITGYAGYNIDYAITGSSLSGSIIGGTILLSSLPPNNYEVKITATPKSGTGDVIQKTAVAIVKPGVLNPAEIKIP